MKENKIWGETVTVWKGNNTEVHRIIANAGGYCSKHKHEHKSNMFFIESGEFVIETWKENDLIDKTTITTGESTIVPPGEYHRFTAIKDTVALEIYWVELKDIDIIRETQGGKNEA